MSSQPAAEATGSEVTGKAARGRRQTLGFERFSGLWALLFLCVLFSVLEPESFPTINNLRIVAANEAITTIVTLGLLVPVATGAFDLSIAGIMSFSVVSVAWLQADLGVNPVLATLLVMLVGATVGCVNGLIVVRYEVHSLIATLGTSSILTALAYWLVGGRPILQGVSPTFKEVGRAQVFSVPIVVFYMLIAAFVVWYFLEFAPVGRRLRAVGGNPDAARLAGLRTGRYVFGAFVFSGVVAALGGVLLTMRLGTAPLNAGDPYLLPAFAAVFLGATQIKPGRMNVWGTVLAIYLLAAGVKGLMLHYPDNPWVRSFFQGAILIIAVSVASKARQNRASR